MLGKAIHFTGFFVFCSALFIAFLSILQLEGHLSCSPCSLASFPCPDSFCVLSNVGLRFIAPNLTRVTPLYTQYHSLTIGDLCDITPPNNICFFLDSTCSRVGSGGITPNGTICTARHVWDTGTVTSVSCSSDEGIVTHRNISAIGTPSYGASDSACFGSQHIPSKYIKRSCIARMGVIDISVNMSSDIVSVRCERSTVFPGFSGLPCFVGPYILAVYTSFSSGEGCSFARV